MLPYICVEPSHAERLISCGTRQVAPQLSETRSVFEFKKTYGGKVVGVLSVQENNQFPTLKLFTREQ